MPISTLEGYPRIGGVIGYGPVGGSGVWKLQERYALADDFYDDVSLLLKMNGANGSTTFLDSSKFGHAVTANGNAQISTTQSKFGGSSLALDGTGDYLTVPSSSTFAFGGDFTIEFWTFAASTSNAPYWLDGRSTSTANEAVPTIYSNSGNYEYWVNGAARINGGSVALNQWIHVAVVRSSTTTTLYVNGTSIGTWSDSTNYAACAITIGQRKDAPSQSLNGYIDSLRITKGLARYKAAYTPPQRDFLP